MKNNKAFTLIELLAVLAILAIISLIAVPISINIINESKARANKHSIELFLRELNNKIYEQKLDGNFSPEICSVNDGAVTCDGTLLFTEKNKINGDVYFNKGDVYYYSLSINNSNIESDATDIGCFGYSSSLTYINIDDYYDYVENNPNNAACPKFVVIPSQIENKPVKDIRTRSFSQKHLDVVVIPSTVQSIRSYAFSDSEITHVTIPNSVTRIEQYAFYNNKLTHVTIPNSVTLLGLHAFSNNQLTSMTIPSSLSNTGDYAFAYNQLTSVTIPNSVTKIGDYSFAYNQLTSVTIPNSVLSIESHAFSFNHLTSVEIPGSVASIGLHAFDENSLTSVTIGSGITNIGNYAFGDLIEGQYGPNKISSITINAHESDVAYNGSAFYGFTGTICWLKDTPTCGS